MKTLYSFTLLAGLSIFGYTSCTPEAATDPKAKLEALRKQQATLTAQIDQLEAIQLKKGITDSSQIKFKQVSLTAVTVGPFTHLIEVQGKVESDQNVDVNPKTMGLITKVYVTEGQSVRRGQILASIDNQILQGNLAQLKSQYSLATILYQKQKNLWDQQIGTEVQYLQAKNAKENLEKNMAIVRDQVAQTNIVAPLAGTVDQVNARVGEMAAAGSALFRVVNTQVLKIRAGLGENYISRVGVGYPITVLFPDAGLSLKAKLSFISKVIDPVTRTFTVQTKVQGTRGIRPNMVAVMQIQDYQNPKALVVPINLVQNSEGGNFVYTALKGSNGRYGTAKRKVVKLGLVQGGNVEIKAGLSPGDLLVTVGYQGLSEGASLSF